MADNSVFIEGIAQGAFKEALDGVPEWATEKTAGDIVEWLKRSYGKQTALLAQAIKCCGGGAGGDEAKKVGDELGKLNRLLHNQNEEEAKALKASKAKRDADKQSLLGGKKLQNFGEKVNYVMSGLAIAGAKVSGVMTNYIDVYDSLYKSGINVMNGNDSTVDGFQALQQTVLLTGLTLKTLQTVAEKYSTSINAAGFQKFARATAMSTTRLESFGFSSEESAELVGSLMEAESSFSDIRRKSAEDISADAVKMGAQFDRLSKTMGISRQQMLDNMKTTAKSTDSTLVAAKWGEKAALNVSNALAGVKDDTVRNALLKMTSAADPVFTQVYKDLQAAGMGDVAEQYATIARQLRTIDPTEVPALLKQAGENISRTAISALADQSAGGNAAAQAALETVTAFKQVGRSVSEASTKQDTAATNTERSIAAFQTQMEKAAAIPEAAFAPMITQVDLATLGLRNFNNAVFGAIGAIDAETRSWIGAGVIVAGFIAGLVLARGALTTFASLFGAESAAASVATKTLGGSLMSLVKSVGSVLGPLALLAGAAYAGWEAGTLIKEQLEKSKGGQEFLDDVGGTMTQILANFGNKEAQETIDQVDRNRIREGEEKAAAQRRAENLKVPPSPKPAIISATTQPPSVKPTTISVPTAPMASTINSPSAVSTPQPVPEVSAGTLPQDMSRSSGPAIPKPAVDADINNLLSYQGSILEKILMSTNDLVSVNKDLLRYARNSA